MKFEFFIARRYLSKGEKKSFVSVISIVSIMGITIGVAALIIALALISGFQLDIRGRLLDSTSHIMIICDESANYQAIIDELNSSFSEIESMSPIVYGTILLKGVPKNGTGVLLRGVKLGQNGDNLIKKLKKSKLSNDNLFYDYELLSKEYVGDMPKGKNDLLIGNEIAKRLKVGIGDKLTAIIPRLTLSPNGLIPRIRKMKVTGIFKSGLYEIDNGTVLTNLQTAQKLFGYKNRVSLIQIFIKDIFNAEKLAHKITKNKKLRNLVSFIESNVVTWKDMNASLFSALEFEKTILFFTLTLIIIVASLNIIAGLILLVIQKMKDIGILLSYGASPRIIRNIFFIQGGIIGIIGTFIGTLIGTLFCYIANKFELFKIPSDIYQMGHVNFNTNIRDVMLVIIVSLIISFTATIIPSLKASKINVIDAVKHE